MPSTDFTLLIKPEKKPVEGCGREGGVGEGREIVEGPDVGGRLLSDRLIADAADAGDGANRR